LILLTRSNWTISGDGQVKAHSSRTRTPRTYPLLFRELAVEELPPGFGFDEYGLLVLEKYAVALPESRETNAAELPEPEPVGSVSPTDFNLERTAGTIVTTEP
jgi:hypothetical protein